jgi:putative ABC transport system permease protein
LVVGVISGAYPAFFLARFKPTEVLTSSTAPRSGNKYLRRGLVILQFFISVVMLISTMVVYNQLDFLRSKDLGFDQNQVVLVELSGRDIRNKYSVLRNKLMEIPDIQNVATSSDSPGNNVGKIIGSIEDNKGEMLERGVDLTAIDFDYVSTMGMHIEKGRDFSKDFLSDTLGAGLVNEAMVARMNWDEPIGKKFQFGDQDDDIYRVIGVLRDYHQNSLYDVIEPLFIYLGQNQSNMFIKLETKNIKSAVVSIEAVWKSVYDGKPFEYRFLDEDFNSQYQADEKRGKIFTIFSALTILIACLGLIGLASYSTEQRTREIGIRKAIGASRKQVMILLSKEFAVLNLIAIVLSIPVAYYFMNEWLQTFSYRIEMMQQVPVFLTGGLLAILVTFISVGYHTIRAANANPVNSLREE